MQSLQTTTHMWRRGDKFYKLAFDHYGDSRLWYIIAWFNKKPTEAHVKDGTILFIPKPLESILSYLKDR